MSFAVVFVCTGNICRSPVAERLFRHRLAPGADVEVSSAGTNGLTGWGIDEPSAIALRALGVESAGHRARRIDSSLILSSDLILTATMEHRSAILRSEPSMMTRTFTLREFARLAGGVTTKPSLEPPDGLPARVASIAARRGLADAAGPGADDVGDPFGGSLADARTCVDALSEAVDSALLALDLRDPSR